MIEYESPIQRRGGTNFASVNMTQAHQAAAAAAVERFGDGTAGGSDDYAGLPMEAAGRLMLVEEGPSVAAELRKLRRALIVMFVVGMVTLGGGIGGVAMKMLWSVWGESK